MHVGPEKPRTRHLQACIAEEHVQLTAPATLAALRIVVTRLPLHLEPQLLSTAHDLFLLFHHICAPSWRLALALFMNQQTLLQQVRQRAPRLWQELRQAVGQEELLRDVLSMALGL
jgi:non-ribosomal peptide synthetase component F